jgi:hypothetical protein
MQSNSVCLKAGSEFRAGYKCGNPQGSDEQGRPKPGGAGFCATDCEGNCIEVFSVTGASFALTW